MSMNFTAREGFALFRLLTDSASDVILKTDRDGFVLRALPSLERVGLRLPGGPIGRHLVDLVHPASADAVLAGHKAAIAGRGDGAWVEFTAIGSSGEERCFEIQSRPLLGDRGRPYGAISVLRCIDERRSFERRLFAAAMTDPLTRLTNRAAFTAMLEHLVAAGSSGCMAMIDIDHFRALNMRHGHAAGDAMLVAFADLLRTLTRRDDILSRIGGESFGVILPDVLPGHAQAICESVLLALAEAGGDQRDSLRVTASAGLVSIGESLDATMQAAELALARAKAMGRNRVESDFATVSLLPHRKAGWTEPSLTAPIQNRSS
jgi:diguanylate cyclase (GGDEF)-like protein/PAS domain S-box-containing protein